MTVRIQKPTLNIREKLSELERPIGINGQALMATDTPQQAFDLLGARNRNLIINGGMVTDQRNNGSSVTPTDGQYTLDRIMASVSQSSKLSIQQNAGSVSPPAGFSHYLGVTSLSSYSSTSTDYFGVLHRIEGYNCSGLAWGTSSAISASLSFWVRSSITGTFSGSLRNSAQDKSYPFIYSISSANTWEYKTITIPGETTGTWIKNSNGIGIGLYFDLGSGTNYRGTSGSWASSNLTGATGAQSIVGTNGATWQITGVQLEVGKVATPFEYRSYGQELALCQRYFQIYGYGANGTASDSCIGTGMFYTPTEATVTAEFKVIMRATPTYSAATVTNGYRYNRAGANTNLSSLPYSGSSSTSAAIFGNISLAVAGVAGYATQIYSQVDGAKISFSAEL